MIGLSILAVIVGYILLSKYIISKIKEKKYKNIVLAILILIPTWDVILGFPVYAYLCLTKSGPKIYQTVENVEGFYIGEEDREYEPYEPYKGYKYIDYKEVNNRKFTGKYYRSYWVDYKKDRKYASICVYPPKPNSQYNPYTKAFNSGKCIVKEEISESELSRWEYYYGSKEINKISFLGIKQINLSTIKDRAEQENIAEINYIRWKAGYIMGYLLTGWGVTFSPSGFKCGKINEYTFLNNTLKREGK